MSDNSRSDSYGSHKSRLSGLTGRKFNVSDATHAIKKGLGHISDLSKNVGASIQSAIGSNKDTSVFTQGSCELDDYGYEKFNIDDGIEVFISKVPERALFNDGEPVNVRATEGNFVGTVEAAAPVRIEEEAPEVVDPRSLFMNVATGSNSNETIRGVTGTVVDGRIEVDNSFLNKVSNRPHVAYEQPVEEAPAEMPAEEAPVVEAVIATPELTSFVEVPVEEASVLEDVVEAVPAEDSHVSEEEAVAETSEPVVMDFEEDSDIIIMDASEEPAEETIVATPELTSFVEAPVEEVPIIDEAAEASEDVEEVTAEVSEDDGSWMYEEDPEAAEILNQAASEEESVTMAFTEAPVEAPIEEVTAEAPVEEVTAEAPVEAPIEDTGIVEGLYTEAAEEVSDAVSGSTLASVASASMAVTGAEAVAPKSPVEPAVVIKGMDESGSDFLPPMADPVRVRPRRTFRFHNGVLQNVDDKKDESEEGLRGPFELTVGQTVSKDTEVLRIPPVPIEDEAEVMRLTIPELDVDEDSFRVGITGDVIPEDGMEAVCFESISEDTPQEVPAYDASCIGLGTGFQAIAAAAPVHALEAATEPIRLPAAEPIMAIAPAEQIMAIAPAEVVQALPAAEDQPILEAEPQRSAPAHAVTFGFGNGDGTGLVCFSF